MNKQKFNDIKKELMLSTRPKVKVRKLKPDAVTPEAMHGDDEDAGYDLFSVEKCKIKPGEYKLVKTGIAIELPENLMGKVAPRSGLALKNGITVLNAEGTIDPGYRGEIGVILINHGKENFSVEKGDRIAQLIIEKFEKVDWIKADNLNDSKRGSGGFGHTGKN